MFEKEAKERAKDIYIHHFDDDVNYPDVLKAITVGVQRGAEFGYNKANEELEEKISVLLSCKNCPENKDGLICQKEYEGKCLAQKIQYIKELKEENAELNSIADFQTSSNMDRYFQLKRSKEQLIKAKKIIRDYKIVVEGDHTTVCSVPEENRCINVLKLNEQAEQFLKEETE